ncbi:hypothetical protein H4Q26_012250 [Puccinia striiformis f. sp. tritici PST-130]|nr:hypothetical protein H4Q26_012250 [Puccinia striiformis f. sp. tritici PST-130]
MLAAEKLLKRYPKDPTFLNLHALISESMGNFDEAARSLERSAELLEAVYEVTESIEIEQRYMLANLNLGRIRLRQKNYEEAIMVHETVLSLRPPFDKTSEPVECALKSTIIRAQAACQIAIARHFLQDHEKALTVLDEALRELYAVQQDKSLRLSKVLAPYSSAVSGLIARVLWSQPNKSKARGLLSETISKNSSEKFIDFDLISSFLAITILEGGSDKTLQARKEDVEIISRLEELILRKRQNSKITRDPKSETNTILNFLEFTIKVLNELPSCNEDAFVKSFETVKTVLGSCIRELRETEVDKQLIKQQAIIFKSFDEEQLPAPSGLTNRTNNHPDQPGGHTEEFDDVQTISLSEQLNFLV